MKMNTSEYINIAAICPATEALGPGMRGAVWVQGCPFNCPDCIAPDWIPFQKAQLMRPDEVVDELFSSDNIDGITFSGGKPMLQAEGLARVAQSARQRKDVNFICFTGYRYEDLINKPPSAGVTEFLHYIDVLIEGPYISKHDNGLGLRGSNNQRIIHISPRLMDYDFENCLRRVELHIRDGEILVVGIPSKNIESSMSLLTKSLYEGKG
ncbi:MAG: 4Fe-4S single cluster domain-containing protein [Anaerolineales bacterium]|nr:4Fe-4S single cluster domain-containing protein [Anaerolineales bacterium]MDP3185010.1 4Fe-4S single cluster domain-containing protein [Anaerolineales bacterium]